MTKIKPFKAIRPVRDKAHLVATRPVFTYKKNVLKAKLEENPYTFIRIIHPEFNEKVKTKPNSKERFLAVKKKFNQFLEEQILVQDKDEYFYLYQQTHRNRTFLGLIAGASVEDYKHDNIKKHEATLTSREEMFTNYLDLVGFNAEPVLLAYPDNPKLEKLFAKIISKRPEYEFSTTDEIKHELWLIENKLNNKILKIFAKIPSTYIADGHHRSASSMRLADIYNSQKIKTENHNYFLAFFMQESKLNILEFNRLVKSVGNLNLDDFIKKLKKSFTVEILSEAIKPRKEHEILMNFKGSYFMLECKPEIIDNEHPVACLDAEILTNFILAPILGIKDLKTDTNIQFVSGNQGIKAIDTEISTAKAELGFVLHPVSFEQVKRVADNQMIMPPKSTWVEPKLRSGLTIYNIKE
jgi:uncharacterized protein (DUF1015 family)